MWQFKCLRDNHYIAMWYLLNIYVTFVRCFTKCDICDVVVLVCSLVNCQFARNKNETKKIFLLRVSLILYWSPNSEPYFYLSECLFICVWAALRACMLNKKDNTNEHTFALLRYVKLKETCVFVHKCLIPCCKCL